MIKFRNSRELKGPKSCWTIVSETYNDFAENTSIHGLKYTVKPEIGRYEKIFWMLIVLSGLCGAGYMTVLFWQRYTSNPTRTAVLTSYAPTTSVPFPAVTICNINKLFLPKVEKFINELEFDENEEPIIRSAFPQLLALISPSVQHNMTELLILQRVLENNGYRNITSLIEKVNQNCGEMFLYCKWNKNNVNCASIFKRTVSINGVCCSFNYHLEGEAKLYTPFSGFGTGLMVLLNPMIQSDQYAPLYSTGFKIHIHNPTEYPGPTTDFKLLPIGRISNIQVLGSRMTCSQAFKDLPVNQRRCLYPDEFRLKYFGKYQESNCFVQCLQTFFFDQCGCVPYFYSFSDKPECNLSNIPCYHSVIKNKLLSKKLNSCKCISQCENVFYSLYSTNTFINYKDSTCMTPIGNNEFTNRSTIVNVYFLGNRQTIFLKDTITSTIYLLSSFGGVYSLFMGCSLITIAEILYYWLFRLSAKMNSLGKVDQHRGEKRRTRARRKRKTTTHGHCPNPQLQPFYLP